MSTGQAARAEPIPHGVRAFPRNLTRSQKQREERDRAGDPPCDLRRTSHRGRVRALTEGSLPVDRPRPLAQVDSPHVSRCLEEQGHGLSTCLRRGVSGRVFRAARRPRRRLVAASCSRRRRSKPDLLEESPVDRDEVREEAGQDDITAARKKTAREGAIES